MAGVAVAQSSPMAALARSSVLFITSPLFVPLNAPGRRESETLGPLRKLDLGHPPLEGGGGASARPMIDRTARKDRKIVGSEKRMHVRVAVGGRRPITKKKI